MRGGTKYIRLFGNIMCWKKTYRFLRYHKYSSGRQLCISSEYAATRWNTYINHQNWYASGSLDYGMNPQAPKIHLKYSVYYCLQEILAK